jgi:hypothetical protein
MYFNLIKTIVLLTQAYLILASFGCQVYIVLLPQA